MKLDIEAFIFYGGAIMSLLLSLYIMRFSWKQYGLLFIITALVGEILDMLFMKLGFYHYPYDGIESMSIMPYTLVMTLFPCYILFGVRYSPSSWKYKLPFYMIIVHLGMTTEVLTQLYTDALEYTKFWDTWDSYMWWWIFLLGFEVIGGLIVSKEHRKPISEENFKYNHLGWYLTHFVLILTIFLGGVYLGTKLKG